MNNQEQHQKQSMFGCELSFGKILKIAIVIIIIALLFMLAKPYLPAQLGGYTELPKIDMMSASTLELTALSY